LTDTQIWLADPLLGGNVQGARHVVGVDHAGQQVRLRRCLVRRTIVLDPSRVAAQIVSGIGFLGAAIVITRTPTISTTVRSG
jgi:putative Mg2+ transporter-C (MgtC) family protein